MIPGAMTAEAIISGGLMEELGLGSHVGFSSVLSMNEAPTCVVISAYSFCLFLATASFVDDADCLNLFFRANNYGT